MSASNKVGAKKVTKIIRKDGIIYRPAGGVPKPQKPAPLVPEETPSVSSESAKPLSTPTPQGKKKALGKVIKRADGTKIVVVGGKIVKTLKPGEEASPVKEKGNEEFVASNNIYDNALSPLTDISADELPSELPTTTSVKNTEKTSQVLNLKRTITNDKRSSSTPLLELPKSTKGKSPSRPLLTKSFTVQKDAVTEKPTRSSYSPKKTSYTKRSTSDVYKGRETSRGSRSYRSRDSEHQRSSQQSSSSHSNKRARRSRSRSPRRARSPRRQRSPHRSTGKHRPPSKKPKEILRPRSKSPSVEKPEKRNDSPRKQSKNLLPTPLSNIDIFSLISPVENLGSKEDILNLIQQQAEDMLKAQHSGPVDEEKKKKLRGAMESILIQRGIISKPRNRTQSLLRASSSESSDGRESPEILRKLNQKYNESANISVNDSPEEIDMEAISPCIDNVSDTLDQEQQKISDVSQSDMEMSDEEIEPDNEDGKTPAFRKKVDASDKTSHELSNKIQIKLGKDEDEEVFQELAACVNSLKSSADVQQLIEAIENRIKTFFTDGSSPHNLERKIKRYQALVAKVVIEAESIKEQEEDNKVTYHTHRRSRSKEAKSSRVEVEKPVHVSVGYPVQPPEQPWLYPTSASNLQQPHTENFETSFDDPAEPEKLSFDKVQAQFVSQRVNYHVCLLCMIETANPSHFQKHLDGVKHYEAVVSKMKQLSTTANVKKFKRHDLVIKCKLCDVICRGQSKYNEHANHRSHQALVQAYVKIGRVVPEPEIVHNHEAHLKEKLEKIQESETPAVGREYMSRKTVKDCNDDIKDMYHCSLCKVNCNSEIQVEKHVRSKKHYLIYVKVNQPEVNVQVSAHEHKKRREATKKIVSTMKTIKQMEAIIEQNKQRKQNEECTKKQVIDEDPVPAPPLNMRRQHSPAQKPFPSFTGYDPNAKDGTLGPGQRANGLGVSSTLEAIKSQQPPHYGETHNSAAPFSSEQHSYSSYDHESSRSGYSGPGQGHYSHHSGQFDNQESYSANNETQSAPYRSSNSGSDRQTRYGSDSDHLSSAGPNSYFSSSHQSSSYSKQLHGYDKGERNVDYPPTSHHQSELNSHKAYSASSYQTQNPAPMSQSVQKDSNVAGSNYGNYSSQHSNENYHEQNFNQYNQSRTHVNESEKYNYSHQSYDPSTSSQTSSASKGRYEHHHGQSNWSDQSHNYTRSEQSTRPDDQSRLFSSTTGNTPTDRNASRSTYNSAYNQLKQHGSDSIPSSHSNVTASSYNSAASSSYKSAAPSSYNSAASSSYKSAAPSSYNSAASSSYNSAAPSSYNSAAPSSYNSGAPTSYNRPATYSSNPTYSGVYTNARR